MLPPKFLRNEKNKCSARKRSKRELFFALKLSPSSISSLFVLRWKVIKVRCYSFILILFTIKFLSTQTFNFPVECIQIFRIEKLFIRSYKKRAELSSQAIRSKKIFVEIWLLKFIRRMQKLKVITFCGLASTSFTQTLNVFRVKENENIWAFASFMRKYVFLGKQKFILKSRIIKFVKKTWCIEAFLRKN